MNYMCVYSLRYYGGLHPHGRTLSLAKANVVRAPLCNSARPLLDVIALAKALRATPPKTMHAPLPTHPRPHPHSCVPLPCVPSFYMCMPPTPAMHAPPHQPWAPSPYLSVLPPCRARPTFIRACIPPQPCALPR
jgi:hypothetical protein